MGGCLSSKRRPSTEPINHHSAHTKPKSFHHTTARDSGISNQHHPISTSVVQVPLTELPRVPGEGAPVAAVRTGVLIDEHLSAAGEGRLSSVDSLRSEPAVSHQRNASLQAIHGRRATAHLAQVVSVPRCAAIQTTTYPLSRDEVPQTLSETATTPAMMAAGPLCGTHREESLSQRASSRSTASGSDRDPSLHFEPCDSWPDTFHPPVLAADENGSLLFGASASI
jgi:hypothetical protein